MKIISFELTMPNIGSWNGRWTGENNKYYVIEKLSDRYLQSKDWFKDLLKDGKDSWHYSWGDGWGATVRVEIVDSVESRIRKKISKGFCGYEWMISSIKMYGDIYASHQIPKEKIETHP